MEKIIELHAQVKPFADIGDRGIACGVPAISQEMVGILQRYRVKYENVQSPPTPLFIFLNDVLR